MTRALWTSARRALAAALLGTAASPALAQAPPPSAPASTDVRETVVVTGSVSPDALGSLGRTIVILTREDLARLPLSTPIDALRLVPSVEVRERGPRGVQADFAIRGAGFGQALVLVNGARLNDAQSGHHNGDIPVSLLDVERIEILLGGGASVHGADAVGGAVNVITRRAGPRFASDIAFGQHDLVEAAASVSLGARPVEHVFSGEFNRSTGFAPDRDHDVKLARYQGTFATRTTLSLAYLDKEFGAAGFYGPSPSREWTDQTLVSGEHRFAPHGNSLLSIDGAYRSHGDRFVYDWRRPALSDNQHRTHAVSANGRWRTALGAATQLSLGASAGRDAIDSTSLGERTFSRAGAVAEVRQAIGSRLVVQPGIRVDHYDVFGTAWSPAIAASGWIVPSLRWRTATGRSFRIPTYTELYYRDPNHLASDDLVPERAWSTDVGVDAFARGWTASATVFGRWDADVIDWVRAVPTERWHTTNIRDVDTKGVELGVTRRLGTVLWGARYTGLQSEAPTLALLSKYVLDYAPHALSLSGAATWRRLDLGSHVTYTRRADGREYWIADLRVAHPVGRAEVYADVANAFDQAYQEVKGVDMPGRWVKDRPAASVSRRVAELTRGPIVGNSGTGGNVLYAMRRWVLVREASTARRLSGVVLAAAVLLAAACGAPPEGVGGAASPTSTPAPAAPAADAAVPATARPRLVVLGDSIAAGYGLRREESFPARLQERLDREGYGFEVVNAGVSGDTSAGGLRRLDWALDGDVRILVVELGGNDGLRGLPPEELKKNLTAIVHAARDRHLAVLLCGMEAPPNAGPAYATAFREAFSTVAREERVPFVRFVLDKVAGIEGLNQDDGIHPNARGARLVADTVWPALQPLLEAVSRS